MNRSLILTAILAAGLGLSQPGASAGVLEDLTRRVEKLEKQMGEMKARKAEKPAVPAVGAERTVAKAPAKPDTSAYACYEDETRGRVRSFSAKTNSGTLVTDAGEEVPVSDYGITFLPKVLKRGQIVCFRVTRDHHGSTNLNPIAIKVRLAEKAEPKPACPRGSHFGHVKWYSNEKGYGFLDDADTHEAVFVHFSAIVMDGYKTLTEGEGVCFEPVQGPKGYQAANVRRL